MVRPTMPNEQRTIDPVTQTASRIVHKKVKLSANRRFLNVVSLIATSLGYNALLVHKNGYNTTK